LKRFGFVRLILCLGVLFFSVNEASAAEATLSGDASVNSAHPSINYGTLSNLYVASGNTAFLQFNLSTLPAGTTSAQVTRATLTVFVNRVNVAGSVTVSPISASWGEYSVTSATAPATGGSIGTLPVSIAGQFVSVDVTAQVQTWLNTPASNNGLALASGGADALFDSKENDETGHAARLDITLVNQGPQGIQGVPGTAGAAGATGAIGPIGPQGVSGAFGPIGLTGAIGPAGAAGPQGPPATFQGTWSGATTYSLGDAVFFNGSSYVSLVGSNTSHQPDTSTPQWSLLAKQGAIGATGAVGPIGPQGPTGVPGLTGAQGPAGPIGSQGPIGPIGVTGSVGPAGPTGATGALGAIGITGPQGPPVSFIGPWNGATPYSIGSAVSEGGTSYIALVANSAINPATDVSGSGGHWAVLAQAGASGTVSVGTTTTGLSGSSASVTNTGTGSAAILNFTIPQGPAGVAGAAGPSGPTGPAGASGGGVNTVVFATELINPGTSAGTTFFLSPLFHTSSVSLASNLSIASATEANFAAAPVACTVSALNVGVNNYSSSAADTTTITIYKNQAATSMTCSATTNGSSNSCKDISHTFSVVGGDSISIAFVETNATPFNKVTIELVCQ
jgi:Collagen triple helix repeat (20 copies)